MDHGQVNHVFTAVGQRLVIFAQTPVTVQPREGAFHNPTFRQDHKAGDIIVTLDNLQRPSTHPSGPVDQLTGIAAVGPDQLQPGRMADEFGQHQLGSVAVLNIGGMDHHRQHQSQRINYQMAFSALYLLAGVISARPPFSTVLTDWLSMIAAEGVGLRPSWRRTCRRRTS